VKLLRVLAILLALSLMIGEAYRSWGAGRPVAFWMDDMLAGGMMIWAAILVRVQTIRTRAFFTGAMGIGVGMLYGSFFGKVFDPAAATPGNFSLGLLTFLVGLAFLVSIIGFVASIIVSFDGSFKGTGS
jgi:hypothetical protein